MFRPETGPTEAVPLDALADECWRLLVNAVAALRALSPRTDRCRLPGDLGAFGDPRLAPLADRVRALASALARDVVHGGSSGAAQLEAAARELDRTLVEVLGLEFSVLKPHLGDALRHAELLLQEMGLEHHGMDLGVEWVAERDRFVAVRVRLAPLHADARLVTRACERVFAWASHDPIGEVELAAAQWSFRGFAGPRAAGLPQAAEARLARELEWVVCDRSMLAFGVPAVRAFLARTRRADVPPRQRGLCRALAESLVGIFSVRRRRGDITLLESLDGRRRFEVREHNTRLPYGPRDYGLGRLIPIGSGRYMRSPGFVFFRPDAAEPARRLAEQTAAFAAQGVDVALAVEAYLRTQDGAAVVPDHGPPAASVQEAQQWLDLAWQRIRARDVGQVLTPDDVPSAVREPVEDGALEVREVLADATLAAWLEALTRQAGRDSPVAPPGIEPGLP